MTRKITSPIFGETREATENERAMIEKICNDTPVDVFQVLNKTLNSKGLCICIDTLPVSGKS